MEDFASWDKDPQGRPILHGLTEVQSRALTADLVGMRLAWAGPLEAPEPSESYVQLVLTREAAAEIGRQLVEAAGPTQPPQGQA